MRDHHSGRTPETASARFITHQGKQILFCDLARCAHNWDALRRSYEVRRVCARQPKKSIVSLIDLTDSRINTRLIRAYRELAIANKPYVIASAVIGANDVQAMVLQGIAKASGRRFKVFDSAWAAKNWLVSKLPD